jgi:predicted PurR-regulated permease PerM
MKSKLTAGWAYGALIVVLSAWILHSFLEALLAACVTAIASWPLYRQFTARTPRWMGRSAASVVFTSLMVVFVLAPLVFAFGALLTEAHALLLGIAAVDKTGITLPHWLESMPWLADLWESHVASPGALRMWTQRIEPTLLLTGAQSIGQFMYRHLFIIAFAILVLFFLYQKGERLAEDFLLVLRHRIGERAEAYAEIATQAVRASVNSVLVVALFDGFASWVAFAMAGVPHAAVWAAITGSLALVPLLGYVAVIALALQLAVTGAATPALVSFVLGCVVLFCGDKIVRPVVARDGTRLPFVWILIGCLGGFEALGLVGLVIGPVVLTLTRELWRQRLRDLALPDAADPESAVDRSV